MYYDRNEINSVKTNLFKIRLVYHIQVFTFYNSIRIKKSNFHLFTFTVIDKNWNNFPQNRAISFHTFQTFHTKPQHPIFEGNFAKICINKTSPQIKLTSFRSFCVAGNRQWSESYLLRRVGKIRIKDLERKVWVVFTSLEHKSFYLFSFPFPSQGPFSALSMGKKEILTRLFCFVNIVIVSIFVIGKELLSV